MAHDRTYFLDNDGHISDPPEEVECVDDQVAIETAILLLNGRAIEVWEGPHRTSRTRSQRKPKILRRSPGSAGEAVEVCRFGRSLARFHREQPLTRKEPDR